MVDDNGVLLYHENLEPGLNGFWVEAKDLRVGDTFLGANGELSTLTGKLRLDFEGGIAVFNIEVEGNHNYFILAKEYEYGQSCVLVHNAGYPRQIPRTKHGDPIPDVDVPHTQLGQRIDNGITYDQAVEWMPKPDGSGIRATRRIDFSDHGFPADHPNPHQHILKPNNPKIDPKGGYTPGPPEPLQ